MSREVDGPLQRLVGRQTREGKEIAPMDALIRGAIKGWCKTCVHCTDMCDTQKRAFGGDGQYRWVEWCGGYEAMTPNAMFSGAHEGVEK